MTKILLFIFFIISIYSKFLSDEEKYVIGLDLGGTNTVFGIVDKKGKPFKWHSGGIASYSDFVYVTHANKIGTRRNH